MCVMLARALRDNGQGKLRMELTITWRRCVLAAIVLCALASLLAWWLIDDRDAAVTLDPEMVERRFGKAPA